MRKAVMSVRKIVCVVLMVFLLTGCLQNLDDIPPLESINRENISLAESQLMGRTCAELELAWGKAPFQLSGFDGRIWQIPGDWDEITVYFEGEDRKVEGIGYSHIMKARIMKMCQETILVEPCEGEWEKEVADSFTISMADMPWYDVKDLEAGDYVLVRHNGTICENGQLSQVYSVISFDRKDNAHIPA